MTRSFHGPLAAQFEEFASLMRSTGAAHVTLLANAHRLDDFLTAGFPCATTLTKDIVSSWFASFAHLRPSSQRRYRSATFQVCHYLRRRDSDTADRSDFESPRRPRDFKPYIFSRAEVYSLLEAARATTGKPPIKPMVVPRLLVS